MSGARRILVLAERPVSEEILSRLDGPLVVADPYEALASLRAEEHHAVVLTAPRPELSSLCRAMRRVSAQTRLVALASVSAEPEVRTLVGRELDDYFIYPPARADLAAIRRLAGIDPTPAAQKPPPQTYVSDRPAPRESGDLRRIATLLEAATGVAALEAAVAQLVGAELGAKVRWVAESGANSQRALLRSDAAPPRVLVGESDEAPSLAAGRLLEELRQLLPALLAAARRTESLHRLAVTDHLTGAYNRRYFYHLTDHILRQAKVSRYRVTLLLYDIDNFKHYNETYGHAAGDDILRETAALMKRTSRSHDVVARIGGDEFAALFWDVQPPRRATSQPLQDFQRLADRFRRAVGAHSFPSLGPEAQGVLSISGGLANFPADGDSCRQLLRSADQALRAVKRSGKNAIQIVGG